MKPPIGVAAPRREVQIPILISAFSRTTLVALVALGNLLLIDYQNRDFPRIARLGDPGRFQGLVPLSGNRWTSVFADPSSTDI